MGLLYLFLIHLAILSLLHWAFKDRSGHKWVYRNPYTRTCTVCGRQEDQHCYLRKDETMTPAWWEEMRPGAGDKCKRGTDNDQ